MIIAYDIEKEQLMKLLFIEYPPCSTCKKAKQHLLQCNMDIQTRHIVEETPTIEELRAWHKLSTLELKKFFNTSGKLYKELHVKDCLPSMSEEEQLQLLSSNGMLIKRPILVSDTHVFVGYKEENYKKLCSEC